MEYLLKVSTITAIFYLFYKLFLQNDTFFQFNRFFLLIGVLSSFIMPFIIIPVYIEYTSANVTKYVVDTHATPIVIENIKESISLLDVVSIIYIVGIIGFLIHFIQQLISLSRIIISNESEKKSGFTVIKTSKQIPPFSFFKWIVYNPTLFNEKELKQVLAHEKIHVNQYHSIDNLIAQFYCILLWFNPFVWLYSKSLKQNLEFIADENAQKSIDCKKSYQYTLLKTSITQQQLAITNNFFNSPIKKRIVMLQKSKSKKMNQLKYALVIPVLALFLMNFNKEEVYIEKEVDDLKIIFHKDLNDEDLNEIKIDLKENQIDFSYNLARNINKEITNISTVFRNTDNTGSVTSNSYTDENGAIKAFYFYKNKNSEGVKFIDREENKLKDKKQNFVEIIFNKNTTLEKLKAQSKSLKEKHNIDFDFELVNKAGGFADFKHSFYNGEQKHEATFPKIFPFKSMEHSLIIKYNLETKLISMGSIVDNVKKESDYLRYLDNNAIGFNIGNTDTDKTLKKYKKIIKEKGVIIEFLDIKRDANNRITKITIDAQTKDSKSSYNYKLDGKNFNGISISFYSDGNGLKIKPVLNTF